MKGVLRLAFSFLFALCLFGIGNGNEMNVSAKYTKWSECSGRYNELGVDAVSVVTWPYLNIVATFSIRSRGEFNCEDKLFTFVYDNGAEAHYDLCYRMELEEQKPGYVVVGFTLDPDHPTGTYYINITDRRGKERLMGCARVIVGETDEIRRVILPSSLSQV